MKPVQYVRYLWNEDVTVLCYEIKNFTAKLNTSKSKRTYYVLVLSQEEPSGSIRSGTNLLSINKQTNKKTIITSRESIVENGIMNKSKGTLVCSCGM